MSGWRNFGIKITEETRKFLVATRLRNKKKMECKSVGDYFVAFVPGYGNPPERPDPLFIEILRRTSARGYYVLANDTTDTGDGLIRFRRGSPLVEITDLVERDVDEEQAIVDGENSVLPEFQMGAPEYLTVYELLGREGFPLLDRYY